MSRPPVPGPFPAGVNFFGQFARRDVEDHPFEDRWGSGVARHGPAHFPDPFGPPVGGHDLEFDLHRSVIAQAFFPAFPDFRQVLGQDEIVEREPSAAKQLLRAVSREAQATLRDEVHAQFRVVAAAKGHSGKAVDQHRCLVSFRSGISGHAAFIRWKVRGHPQLAGVMGGVAAGQPVVMGDASVWA